MVQLYWTQNCAPCARTKQWLKSKGVEYDAVELKTAQDFEEKIGPLGFKSVPVAVTENGAWNFGEGLPKLKGLLNID